MKILLTSEFTGLQTTGYSRYYNELAHAFYNAGHEVVELASYGDCNNDEHVYYAHNCPWTVYLNVPHNNDKVNLARYEERDKLTHDSKFGSWQYEQVCLSEFPDVVISLRDFWYDKFILDSPLSKYMTVILSPTVDALPQKDSWLDGFAKADYITSYNEWSESWLREQYNQSNLIPAISPPPNTIYFMMDKNLCKEKLSLPKDKKVVLTVMRNQGRKRYPELFEAFSRIQDNNIVLYCHTHHQDRGWDLVKLANEYGILHKLYFTYKCKSCSSICANIFNINKKCKKCGSEMAICAVHEGASLEDMNIIYNSCDLYVQYHNSEGFGYPSVEAAACGKRVLSINYSAQEDVIKKISGIPIKYSGLQKELNTNCCRALPDNKHFVELLNNPSIWEYSQEEILNEVQKNYSYANTTKKWVDLINSIQRKNSWTKPFSFTQPIAFEQIKDLPNHLFIKICILKVACRPDLLGTYLHAELLNHLEVGSYIPEDKFNFNKAQFMVPIKKDAVYNRLRRIYETTLSWEKARVKRLQSLNQTK